MSFDRRRFILATGSVLLLQGCGRGPVTVSSVPEDTAPLTVEETDTLAVMVRDLFPGPGLTDVLYGRVVKKLIRLTSDDMIAELLSNGIRELDSGADWRAMTPTQRAAGLRQIAISPFFQYVRYQAVTTLYSDFSVWALYGYEGESFSKGGYLGRGFANLDWLPEPKTRLPWPV